MKVKLQFDIFNKKKHCQNSDNNMFKYMNVNNCINYTNNNITKHPSVLDLFTHYIIIVY